MYAVIATGGKQYKVSEGDIVRVEKLGAEKGDTVTFDNVLAVSNDGLKVGEDVKGATVEAEVVRNGRAKKVIVYKYKPKKGRDSHRRATQTTLMRATIYSVPRFPSSRSIR